MTIPYGKQKIVMTANCPIWLKCNIYLYLIKIVEMQKDDVLMIILFLYALYGTIETGLYMITHNIFLIAFSVLIYGKSLQVEDKPSNL